MKHVALLSLSAVLVGGLVDSAQAAPRIEEVSAGVGIWEVFDENKSWAFSGEARFSPIWSQLRPLLHATVTEDGAYFVGGGLAYTFEGERPWGLTLGVAPGFFQANGGPDLGGNFQIQSFVEGHYRLSNRDRISVRLGHISNASVRETNPGAEILTLQYSVSLE